MKKLLIPILAWLCASAALALPLEPRQVVDKASVQPLPPETPIERVVLKLQEGSRVRLRKGLLVTLERDAEESALLKSSGLTESRLQKDLAEVQRLTLDPRVRKLRRLFQASEEVLAQRRLLGEAKSGRELADLDLYFELPVPAGTTAGDVQDLLDQLNALPSVELAYAQPFPSAAGDIPPTTPNFQSNQGYLNPAPRGIDALFSWTKSGGKGQGVKIVDVELGWQTTHEDLPPLFHFGGVQSSNDSDINHGTAVLGEMVAVDNGYGVTGISNLAQAGVESVTFQATSSAVTNASIAGDVVLIELHQPGPTVSGSCDCNPTQCHFVPMEWSQDVFDAIANATATGDIVVEAAGNGTTNLDDPVYGGVFNRAVRDSGAVLVGASLSSDGGTPSCFTNWGSRVDVHGWGDGVTTTGYGDLFNGGGDPNQRYTSGFSGTSSASPIVTGAVAAIKGVALANGIALTPARARQILTGTGTPQQPSSKHIGPLPDLRTAIPNLLGQRPNLLQNANFETGSLSPWFKFPSAAPGIVAVESCCANQTPGGTWDGYIQPQGEYVELTQKVNVIPGKRYRLAVTVSTKGMTGELYWDTNVTTDTLCASTTVRWPAVTRLQCDFTIPFGATSFNVHLAGTSAAGNWTISDDWSLTDINDL
jgi:serine protease